MSMLVLVTLFFSGLRVPVLVLGWCLAMSGGLASGGAGMGLRWVVGYLGLAVVFV